MGGPAPTAAAGAAASTGSTTAAVVPKSWGNVGNLDIDLDNLSLKGRGQKKNNVPMNAMKTGASPAASSSSDSPMSPGRQAPFPGPAGGAAPAAAGNNNLLNDLL